MGILPIVERELRVSARKTSLYWGRLGFAGVAMLIGTLFLFGLSRGRPNQVSHQMFVNLVNLSLIYCAMVGVWVTSDCLSVERRNETLGLLFLTNLKGVDVVLGKMMATSLQSVYGVIAVFPVMAIPLIIGGVSVAEFCRVMLILILTLLGSLSVGVLVSAGSRSAVKAGVGVFFLMLGLCALGPLIAMITAISSGWDSNEAFGEYIMSHSPGFALYAAYDAYYGKLSGHFWAGVIMWALLTVFCLTRASRRIQWGWRDSHRAEPKRILIPVQRPLAAPSSWRGGSPVGEENPIYWMFTRNRSKPVWVYLGIGVVGLYWLWGMVQFAEDFFTEGNYLFTAFILQLMLKCWVGAEAATRFGGDRQSGALELLLCTPIRVREILRGHFQSLHWQFFWPVILVLLVEFVFLLEPVSSRWALVDPATRYWVRTFIASMVLFVLDLYALSWLGMWKGLNSRFVNRAILSNLFTVLALPWAAFVLLVMFITTASGPRGLGGGSGEEFLLALWVAIGGISSASWWYWGRRCLTRELRHMATSQVGERKMVGASKA